MNTQDFLIANKVSNRKSNIVKTSLNDFLNSEATRAILITNDLSKELKSQVMQLDEVKNKSTKVYDLQDYKMWIATIYNVCKELKFDYAQKIKYINSNLGQVNVKSFVQIEK